MSYSVVLGWEISTTFSYNVDRIHPELSQYVFGIFLVNYRAGLIYQSGSLFLGVYVQ